jgi:predicted amidohydrolase YtcJ
VARDLVQHVVVTGAPDLDVGDLDPLGVGPAKVVVDDRNPPSIDALADQIATAHRRRGTVALHCASRLALVLTVAAFEQVGACAGDRVEHGAVVPPELFVRLRDLGLTVVTQPAFVHARGDRYLADVEPEDVPHLWRCASLREAGIRVGFGSDAPHGPLDPWLAIRSATDRCTRDGRVLGADERVEGSEALARYLAPADDPGGPPRRVEVGAPGDLCLLHAPVGEVLRAPSADAVRATMVAGVFAAP